MPSSSCKVVSQRGSVLLEWLSESMLFDVFMWMLSRPQAQSKQATTLRVKHVGQLNEGRIRVLDVVVRVEARPFTAHCAPEAAGQSTGIPG